MVALSKIDNGVYRFYNSAKGAHFYTASYDEAKSITETLPAFQYEGVAYRMGGAAGFYRFYNKVTGTHFFTASPEERDAVAAKLSDTYTYEGVAYNVFLEKGEGRVAIYRFYNKKTGTHFFTADQQEYASVKQNLSDTYVDEGIAAYALEKPKRTDQVGPVDPKKPVDPNKTKPFESFTLTLGEDRVQFSGAIKQELILAKGAIGGDDIVKGLKMGDLVKLVGFSQEELNDILEDEDDEITVTHDAAGNFYVSEPGYGSITLVGVSSLTATLAAGVFEVSGTF